MSNAKASASARLQMDEADSQPIFSMNYSAQEEALHILHVDDDASLLQLSKMILESENQFQIDTATSVDEACEKLNNRAYDAIVSDYDMPRKNGLDFLKRWGRGRRNVADIERDAESNHASFGCTENALRGDPEKAKCARRPQRRGQCYAGHSPKAHQDEIQVMSRMRLRSPQ